jgi:hypothetical protein
MNLPKPLKMPGKRLFKEYSNLRVFLENKLGSFQAFLILQI